MDENVIHIYSISKLGGYRRDKGRREKERERERERELKMAQ